MAIYVFAVIGYITRESAERVLEELRSMDSVLGVFYSVPSSYFSDSALGSTPSAQTGVILKPNEIPAEVSQLISTRSLFKSQKQYAEADNIRKQLSEMGYEIKDAKNGIEVTRK
jgi:cysteinyl-tRNA synthetase